MIGNDIIDLNASRKESNWQRKGWIQKVFSLQEQCIIQSSHNKEVAVWLLWSMKEAAYKIYNRISKKSFYAPGAFHCNLSDIEKRNVIGTVSYKDFHCVTESFLCDNYIHTIAFALDKKAINISIEDTNHTISKIPSNLLLRKDNYGIPYLFNSDTGECMNASLSHHGDYIALVY